MTLTVIHVSFFDIEITSTMLAPNHPFPYLKTKMTIPIKLNKSRLQNGDIVSTNLQEQKISSP